MVVMSLPLTSSPIDTFTDTEGGADEVFLPGIPLAQNEDDFAVAAFDSPAGAMCDAVGGRVVSYFSFREALVPKARRRQRHVV